MAVAGILEMRLVAKSKASLEVLADLLQLNVHTKTEGLPVMVGDGHGAALLV
jgi:hypothetical protein